MANAAVAGLFIFFVACGVSLGVASADSTDDLARAGAFGFDAATHEATQGYQAGVTADLRAEGAAPADDATSAADTASAQDTTSDADTASAKGAKLVGDGASEPHILATTAPRDLTAGLAMMEEREAAERAQVEADNKAVLGRVAAEKAMQRDDVPGASASHASEGGEASAEGDLDEYGLAPVDWSVGKYAFIAEWGERIDKYLENTVLEGYGTVFAEAAWRNGVDPRWSPAISNTESGNGAHCFLPHNAWGWGQDPWPDWETAINDHVAGLAKGYGYSVTVAAAQKYCPPNSAHWYKNTLGQMALI